MFSVTDISGTRLNSWSTIATPASRASLIEPKDTSLPSRWIVPPSRWTAPARIFPSVDLPAPFSPTRASTSPWPTVRSTPARARVEPYLFSNCRASSMATVEGIVDPLLLREDVVHERILDLRDVVSGHHHGID